MKICLLGDFSPVLDEAMKKTAYYIAKELEKRHQVLRLDLKDVFTIKFWIKIKRFKPDITHHIYGPSIQALILLKFISLYCHSKTVVSVLLWNFSSLSKFFIPVFKPNIMLVKSFETKAMFTSYGINTIFFPCGVDINKFMPVSLEDKIKIREKFKLDKDKLIVLHIGSIKSGRNIQVLEQIQKNNCQVIILGGSLSTGIQKELAVQLEQSGCMLWIKYIENVEEIYALADCYLFPTSPEFRLFSIEMPLSVLEALSCNLPVITTKFLGLSFFEEGDGLFFVEKESQFMDFINKIRQEKIFINTRSKVQELSWEKVGIKLDMIYTQVINYK